jgi:hypothetical protein
MDAEETIEHFEDMGVLRKVFDSVSGNPMIIMATATKGYAHRCMQDFKDSPSYYEGIFGIDAITNDGVAVRMCFVGQEEDPDPYENVRGEDL